MRTGESIIAVIMGRLMTELAKRVDEASIRYSDRTLCIRLRSIDDLTRLADILRRAGVKVYA